MTQCMCDNPLDGGNVRSELKKRITDLTSLAMSAYYKDVVLVFLQSCLQLAGCVFGEFVSKVYLFRLVSL